MTLVLALFVVTGVLGAWDTLWYHEWKARLVEQLEVTRTELKLHVARDAIYTGVYFTLAWWQPAGWLVYVLAVMLCAEIVITLADFVVEDRDRPQIGGLAPGERILHTLMAIVYGAAMITLVPELAASVTEPVGFVRHQAPVGLSLAGTAFAFGIAVTGLRDVAALCGHDVVRISERTRSLV